MTEADAILERYQMIFRAANAALDEGRDEEAATLHETARQLFICYDRALMAESDALSAQPLSLRSALRMY